MSLTQVPLGQGYFIFIIYFQTSHCNRMIKITFKKKYNILKKVLKTFKLHALEIL